LFFRHGFVESVARDAAGGAVLDEPARAAAPLQCMSRLHSQDPFGIIRRVQTLAKRCSASLMPSSLEEDALLIARDLLLLYGGIASRVNSVRAEKASTREELFRRVEAGREYMHAHAGARLSLEDVSRAACLSRFHFHRAFVAAWGKTPHEYLTAIRLGRAKELLETGVSVDDTCSAVGFESASSFSRLFRSMHGVPPGRAREIRKTGHSLQPRLTVLSGS
jgi:AraC-like DNA-binding protein